MLPGKEVSRGKTILFFTCIFVWVVALGSLFYVYG